MKAMERRLPNCVTGNHKEEARADLPPENILSPLWEWSVWKIEHVNLETAKPVIPLRGNMKKKNEEKYKFVLILN
jgi:hypothetical protein